LDFRNNVTANKITATNFVGGDYIGSDITISDDLELTDGKITVTGKYASLPNVRGVQLSNPIGCSVGDQNQDYVVPGTQ